MSHLPQNIDAERSALGALMKAGLSHPDPAGSLRAEQFTGPRRPVAEATLSLLGEGHRADLETVLSRLGEKAASVVQDAARDAAASRAVPANLSLFAEGVRTAHQRRRLIEACRSIEDAAFQADTTEAAQEAQAEAERAVLGLSREAAPDEALPLSALVRDEMKAMEAEHGKLVTGVTTGFERLNRRLRGWQRGDLVVIGGRTSMGKSALALSTCLEAAKAGHPALYVSLEMNARRLTRRLLCMIARVPGQKITRTEEEWSRLSKAAGELEDLPLFLVDGQGYDVTQFASMTRRMHAEEGIEIAALDYIQNISAARGKDFRRRDEALSHAAKEMQRLAAKELGITILCVSQINRGAETRGNDKRPSISDLRESGGIEDAADVIALLYRPEYYGITTDLDGNSTEGIAEIIIGKNRNGSTGVLRLAFQKEYARFANLETFHEEGERVPNAQLAAPRPESGYARIMGENRAPGEGAGDDEAPF